MTFQQSGNTMEQNKTFKIVIEDYYLEEIIRRNDNLERYKNHLLSFLKLDSRFLSVRRKPFFFSKGTEKQDK